MINRIAAMNGGSRGQQQAGTPTQATQPAVDDKNAGTEEQAARLDAFLQAHPHGSTWNNNNIYKNYGACAAFAVQAQQTIFGEDADYVWSNDLNDIRQYSAVELMLTSGTHWVFILEVNEDGTYKVAEGNVNGKVRIGCNYTITQNMVDGMWNPA